MSSGGGSRELSLWAGSPPPPLPLLTSRCSPLAHQGDNMEFSASTFEPLMNLMFLPEETKIQDFPLHLGLMPFQIESHVVYRAAYIISGTSSLSPEIHLTFYMTMSSEALKVKLILQLVANDVRNFVVHPLVCSLRGVSSSSLQGTDCEKRRISERGQNISNEKDSHKAHRNNTVGFKLAKITGEKEKSRRLQIGLPNRCNRSNVLLDSKKD
ncbi:hypothetical protein J6590_036625 [Homalodisca vitripennis]|nr:hypothetical protein J6590_036625 [Homalodisca vitripennis]